MNLNAENRSHLAVTRSASRAFLFAITLTVACSRKPSDVPTLKDGTVLAYRAQRITGNSAVDIDLRLKLTRAGDDGWTVVFESPPGTPPIKVNGQLLPQDKLIYPFAIGRLWIPKLSRADGIISDCGRAEGKRAFRTWPSAWPFSGRCGSMNGTWRYDDATGMLLGWQATAPEGEFTAYLIQ